MARWDQDIHRIQDIRQLLESRQRFFRGQLDTVFYKVDKQGNPRYFPQLQPSPSETYEYEHPSEPSIGQSLEANVGSENRDYEKEQDNYIDIKIGSSVLDDLASIKPPDVSETYEDYSSDGHNADQSDSSSDDFSEDEGGEENKVKVKKRRDPSSRLQRSITNPPNTAVITWQKNVSFVESSPAKATTTPDDEKDEATKAEKRNSQSRLKLDATYLLKKKSWLLRNEVARRLDESDLDVDRKALLHRVTKGTLNIARNKLRKAENSLLATVKDDEKFMKKLDTMSYGNKGTEQPPKPPFSKRIASRLAVRHAEEALKSDLNLREAFALIKIDPDPLLELASVSVKEKGGGGIQSKREPKHYQRASTSDFYRRTSAPRVDSTIFDDPETLRSLRKLARLSAHHRQRQKSLVPDITSLQIQGTRPKPKTKGAKDKVKKEAGRGKGEESKDKPRKGSSAATGAGINKQKNPKRSRDYRRNNGPKLAFSGLEATLRAERKGDSSSPGQHHLAGYRMEKLGGTVL